MNEDQIALQWTPPYGPRRRLVFKPANDDWIRTVSQWDGREWNEIEAERVVEPTIYAPGHTDTDPTPESINRLCNSLGDISDIFDPTVLVFEAPNPIIIASLNGSLRYYTAQLACWQPISEAGLSILCTKHGLPTTYRLSETDLNRSQLTQGMNHG